MKENNLNELEILLDACPYLTWIKDTEGSLVYVNKIYADMLEKSKVEILGKKEKELWGTQLEKGYVYSVDKEVYLEVHEMELYEEGKLIGKKGIAKDITMDRKIIRQFEVAYSSIADSVNTDVTCDEYKEIIEKFQEAGQELFESLKAEGVMVVVGKSKDHCIWYSKGFTEEEQERLQNCIEEISKKGLRYESTRAGEIQEIKDLKNNQYRDLLENKNIKTIMRYPIIFDGEILGAAIVYNPKTIPDFYMSTIYMYIGVTIKNLVLSERVINQIKKRIEAEQELQLFFKKSNQIMVSIDQESNIKVIGNRGKRILGWDNEELYELIKEDTKIEYYLEQAKLHKGGPLRVEKRCLCKDGNYKDIEWNIKYREDKAICIIIGQDITKSKKEEEEYLRLQIEMELEYIKGELLSCMSNEFKTPVNTILYTIELLQDKMKDSQMKINSNIDLDKYMGLIRQNAYRLIRLINNLVDSNSIEAGEYTLNLGPHNIVQIIKDISGSVEEYVQTKGIKLTFKTVIDELMIDCDPDKIERIMLNLISNAIKYTDEGGEINIRIEKDHSYLSIHVSDNGEGIHGDRLETIFERFAQGENGLTRKREGSGIGLSLVKSLVQMHQGEVEVKSELSRGTEFIVKLPILKLVAGDEKEEEKYGINNNTEVWNIEFADIYE